MRTGSSAIKRPPQMRTPRAMRVTVQDVIEDALKMVDGLLTRLFAKADDHFFDQANKAEGSIQQVVLLDAMRVVRLHREDISGRFSAGLSSDIRHTWPNSDQAPERRAARLASINLDQMSIQSDAEAEISAAKAVIVSRGSIVCGHQHATLRATLNTIFDTKEVNEASSPLGPSGLTDRFCESLSSLALENSAITCLLSLFEREVVENLGDVYARILSELKALNIGIVGPNDQLGTDKASGKDDSPSKNGVSMPFSQLKQRLPRVASAAGPGGKVSETGAVAFSTPAQVVNSLQAAHCEYLDRLGEGSLRAIRIPSLKTFLQVVPSQEDALQHAGSDDLDVVRLVSDLFDHIFSNSDSSLACRELIARLQFPVLAMAILDKSFFGDSEHPARLLLNRVGQDGIGWPASETALKNHRIYLAAEALVQGITDVFPDVTRTSFVQALERWEALVDRKRNQTEVAERRINEAVLGQARLNAARRIVERELNVAAGREMPGAVVAFITDVWFHVLVTICMKYGTESERWLEAKEVYLDLANISCRGQLAANVDIAAIVSNLTNRLGSVLKLAGRVDVKDWKAVSNVEHALQANLASSMGTQACDTYPRKVMQPLRVSAAEELNFAAETDERLAGLVPGTWIEIKRDSDPHPLRCRLVVIVDETQTFVFANDEGLRVYDCTSADLVKDLESGEARVLDEEPLVDRAMGNLLHALMDF